MREVRTTGLELFSVLGVFLGHRITKCILPKTEKNNYYYVSNMMYSAYVPGVV